MTQELSPEERTIVLMHQDVRRLSTAFRNIEIQVLGTDRKIRVNQTRPYLIAENNGMYRRGHDGINVDNLHTGTLWALYWPLRAMRLSLVTAREQSQKGACIDLERASRFDPQRGLYIPMKRKGDIANFLELENNEALDLKFIDDSSVLYVDRGARALPELEPTTPMIVDSEAADRYIRALLGE